jgi:hypothetical protein
MRVLTPNSQGPIPRSRTGAILSFELLLVLPIVVAVVFGMVELSLLLMGLERVQTASSAACRVATLPTGDPDVLEQAVREAAAQSLLKASLVQTYEIHTELGQFPGDPVTVEIRVPMKAAAPDLLKLVGFSLEGRQLVGRTVMRKQ